MQGQIAPLNPELKDAMRAAWVNVDTLARADRNDNPFVRCDLQEEQYCHIMKMAGDVTAESQKLLKKLAGALHVEPVRCYGAHIPLSHIHTRYGAALRRPRTSSATRGQGPAGDHK